MVLIHHLYFYSQIQDNFLIYNKNLLFLLILILFFDKIINKFIQAFLHINPISQFMINIL